MGGKRVRRQPQRTCVGCRSVRAKRELVRIVHTPEDEFVIDTRGKVSGRGAYLCPLKQCWITALERKGIERALKATLPPDVIERLRAYAAELPDAAEPASDEEDREDCSAGAAQS